MSANLKCILFATTILSFLGLSTTIEMAFESFQDGAAFTALNSCRITCRQKVCFFMITLCTYMYVYI